jgi:predicted ATPase/class 3 adenylate cyclase
MPTRPTGTVTFLLTDVEGSTRAWEAHPDAMAAAMARHDAILRGAIEAHGGYVFSTAGDAFASAFAGAADAAGAALDVQRALHGEPWPPPVALRVRVGLHTGDAVERDGDYFGPTVNRAARIMAAGHGGQTLASAATARALDPAVYALTDLGEHRLRDLDGAERLVQVGGDGLPAEFPPLRTADRYESTLPAQRSTFVGRDEERRRVAQLLATHRLVTLTGVGGTGKTRLAIEVAHAAADEAPGGVFFVDLGRIGDEALVWQAVAAGIAFTPDAATPIGPQVTGRLRARRALLVVDNCEHVIDEAAPAVDEILAACPEVRILATSREALGVDGERVHAVRPLSTEASDGRLSPAVRLFLERATAADAPAFGAADVVAIREICARLDGLPLAIELAAGRLGLLSPAEILARLEDRFRLLTGGRRGKRSRHRTLEETIAWSYDLLDDGEQFLLRQLSVFPAAFALSRASAVATRDERETLDLLDGLVARSLVQTERPDEGATRYRLLETIREYAQAKLLEAGEAEAARHRHLVDTTERMEAEHGAIFLVTPAVDELQDDVLVALDRADAAGEHDLLTRLAGASGDLFRARGMLGPGRAWLRRALDVAPEAQRGALHVALAGVEMIRTSYGAMLRHARAARPLLADDPALEALALFYELTSQIFSDHATTGPVVARARTLLEGGLPSHHASVLFAGIGSLQLWIEEDDQAVASFREARQTRHGAGTTAAMATAGLLFALAMEDRWEEIDRVVAEEDAAGRRDAWRESARRGAQWDIVAELGIANAMAARGDVAGARRLVADLHLLLGRDRVSGVDTDLLATLAAIRLRTGEPARARALLDDALWVARTHATTPFAYRTLAEAAGLGRRGTVAWRSDELRRRYAMDHAALDAAARSLLDEELESLGLVLTARRDPAPCR